MRRVLGRGQVSHAVTTFNKKLLFDKPQFSTTLWDDVTHVVDLLRFMVGSEPVEVTRYRDKFESVDWNHYTALVRFASGATGVVFGNRASGGRVLSAELHGVGIGCYMKLPEEIDIREDDQQTVLQAGRSTAMKRKTRPVTKARSPCTSTSLIPCATQTIPVSDLRDVIHTIRLVDWIETGHCPD